MNVLGWRIDKLIAIALFACAVNASAETAFLPTLKLGLEERYDSDFLLRQDNPQGTGQLITKIAPQIGLDVKDHTLNATSFYASDVYFRHGSSVTGVDHRGALEIKKETSRTTEVDGKVKIWRVSDPTSLPRLGLAREISPILFGTAEVIGAIRLSARTTLRAGYLFEGVKVYETDRGVPAFLNAPYVETWYRATRRTEIGAEYRFQYFSLGGSRADSHALAAAYRYHFTRHSHLTARAGPVLYEDRADSSRTGWLPRVNLEFVQDLPHFQIALVAGHDLTGASGFSAAFWADYASLYLTYKVSKPLGVFGGASYYRNGRAPNQGLWVFDSRAGNGTSQGYAVGGGLEWRIARYLALQGALYRIAQVAGPSGGVDLSRNIASVRMVLTAL